MFLCVFERVIDPPFIDQEEPPGLALGDTRKKGREWLQSPCRRAPPVDLLFPCGVIDTKAHVVFQHVADVAQVVVDRTVEGRLSHRVASPPDPVRSVWRKVRVRRGTVPFVTSVSYR